MNEEIRNNEIREDELKNVNGGTGLGILPGFDPTKIERQNTEIKKTPIELDDDALASVAGGNGVPAILNPFNLNKGVSRG